MNYAWFARASLGRVENGEDDASGRLQDHIRVQVVRLVQNITFYLNSNNNNKMS